MVGTGVRVVFQRCDPRALPPVRVHESDSGWDLSALDHFSVAPGRTVRIRTGLSIQLPEGYEGQIRPRSGLSSKGLLVVFGTVDTDYRGELEVIVHNATLRPFDLSKGTRIAQLVVVPKPQVFFVEGIVEPTARGGFGSTGI